MVEALGVGAAVPGTELDVRSIHASGVRDLHLIRRLALAREIDGGAY